VTNLDRGTPPDPHDVLPSAPSFTVESESVADGASVDSKFTHSSVGGDNQSPHLRWSGFPEQTKSFAVTCYDPDAPTGSGFWHWVAWDIPASVTELNVGASGNAMPAGSIEGRTDFGSYGYGGPAPPAGDRDHRYVFTVHAVDIESLGLAADTPAAQVGFNLTFHTLGRAAVRPIFGVEG
jgi:Raf kinase inhibitor-like YbhB/YbcL family protein